MLDLLYEKSKINLRLRLINNSDLEFLRCWKNANKSGFFNKKDITLAMQEEWYASYLEDKKTTMYMVEEYVEKKYISFGCIGYRFMEDWSIDIYNVIRGVRSDDPQATMSRALLILNSFLIRTFRLDIFCRVVHNNPALFWYEKNGFVVLEEKAGYNVCQLIKQKIEPIEFEGER